MATHAIVAVQHKDNIYAKFSHYGLPEDYRDNILCTSYDEFFESVMLGDSSEPFDGSYLDVDHCVKELGWSVKEFVKEMPSHCTKSFATMEKLFEYAKKNHASFIYLMHEDEDCTLKVFEYYDSQRSYEDITEEFNNADDEDDVNKTVFTYDQKENTIFIYDKEDTHNDPDGK